MSQATFIMNHVIQTQNLNSEELFEALEKKKTLVFYGRSCSGKSALAEQIMSKYFNVDDVWHFENPCQLDETNEYETKKLWVIKEWKKEYPLDTKLVELSKTIPGIVVGNDRPETLPDNWVLFEFKNSIKPCECW